MNDWIDIAYLNKGKWEGIDSFNVKLSFTAMAENAPTVEFCLGPLEMHELIDRLNAALKVREKGRAV